MVKKTAAFLIVFALFGLCLSGISQEKAQGKAPVF